MRILLATAHPHLPQIVGGAQSSMHQIAGSLTERGHSVAILCGLTGAGIFGFKRRVLLKLHRQKMVQDEVLGYRVYRAWDAIAAVKEAAADFDADVVVPQSGKPVGLSKAAQAGGVPSVIYFRNVDLEDFGGNPKDSADSYIANSCFTAARVREEYEIDAIVIPPMVARQNYQTATSQKYITFVNPHPHKGRNIAFDIAKNCPDLQFLFVKAWTLSFQQEKELRDFVTANPNVTVWEPVDDMRAVYSITKVILAPSQWEEAWGRIATEAHYSGIPVIASEVGGLPEAVGPGGTIMPVNSSVEDWVAALRSLAFDQNAYTMVSNAALKYSSRPEMNLENQLDKFLSVCEQAIAKHPKHNVDMRRMF